MDSFRILSTFAPLPLQLEIEKDHFLSDRAIENRNKWIEMCAAHTSCKVNFEWRKNSGSSAFNRSVWQNKSTKIINSSLSDRYNSIYTDNSLSFTVHRYVELFSSWKVAMRLYDSVFQQFQLQTLVWFSFSTFFPGSSWFSLMAHKPHAILCRYFSSS